MRCEVVAIGTELLLGTVVDTNSSWIGEQLALAGIDCVYQVKVGDNFARMEATIRQALERADAVICCGGLGPTQDDITRDVIARVMGVEVRRDGAIGEKIRAMFESRGRTMSANNLRQADIPIGAYPIPQMPGTAPGLVCPMEGPGGSKVIYAVPGVPREMREMLTGTVLPDLRRRSGQVAVIRSRTLRTWGLSESGIDEMLTERMAALDKLGNPTIAFNASGIEGIKVRVTAKCDDEAAAAKLLDAEEKIIRGVLGDAVFGLDDQAMEDVVLGLLKARGLTIAAHETITGGILSTRMSARDTAMTTFRGAIVAADPGATGGKPEQRAAEAATRARETFKTDVGLAAIAPAPDEGYPAGTVFQAIVLGQSMASPAVDKAILFSDRPRQREYTVINLLNGLRRLLA